MITASNLNQPTWGSTSIGTTVTPSTFGITGGGSTMAVAPSPSNSFLVYNNLNNQQIMQNKVAVFKITRDEDEKIIKTEFIKELWVETKIGQSVDFQVARDKDLADYEMSDLSIKTIHTISF
jgi:hypothetical protein